MSSSTTAALPSSSPHPPPPPPIIARIEAGETMPVCVIFVGMAGSGKTTLVSQLQQSLESATIKPSSNATETLETSEQPIDKSTAAEATTAQGTATETTSTTEDDDEDDVDVDYSPAYCVNLDPATINVPYHASIDIRDTVKYKQVMKQHKLGPNGAILTSLNLFATKFDQVMGLLEKRAYGSAMSSSTSENSAPLPASTAPKPMEYILIDTPGQIEAFTWSASGSIISESLASAFPTVLCFVVDTARCAASPNTFMSNMLYACSMLYRTRLPLVVCFNKTDVVSHEFCLEWMRDSEAFQQALDDTAETSGFYGSLTRSLSLVLDEFYSNFANACGVSAVTGSGTVEFWKTVQKAATQDFCLDYIEDLKNRMEEHDARRQAIAQLGVQMMQRDLETEDDSEDEEY
jgi:GPN-loop GTPase